MRPPATVPIWLPLAVLLAVLTVAAGVGLLIHHLVLGGL
jgi:hypothetical protein